MYHVETYLGAGVAWFVLYLVSGLASDMIVGEPYRKLSKNGKVDWNSRVVSTIHALFVSQGGIRALLQDEQFRNDPFYGYTDFGGWYAAVFSGYIVYDLLLTLVYPKALFSPAMVFHHLVCLTMTSFPLTDWGRHRFLALGCIFLINEISTPLLNHRAFLKALGTPLTSRHVQYTQYAFGISFFWCRVVVEGYALKLILTAPHLNTLEPLFYYAVIIIPAAFFLLQCYWFWLIISRVLFPPSSSKHLKSKSKDN
eukprot:TRINITY_DN5248_c0_g2_i1.p1 TRINITY_DN5248_c0_g2~~TRINITY_DN5248_c0_g2_i1.p1  ORF type:complete len:278 (+),score=28.88 TRINITY_DN5248_c0_g2_i1:74-835(+)